MSALPAGPYSDDAAVTTGEDMPAAIASTSYDLHVAAPAIVEVMCECGGLGCTGRILISLSKYQEVRNYRTRFLIKEGHEVVEAYRVVDQGTGYVVVAKDRCSISRERGLL
jgi:hypothetical protein